MGMRLFANVSSSSWRWRGLSATKTSGISDNGGMFAPTVVVVQQHPSSLFQRRRGSSTHLTKRSCVGRRVIAVSLLMLSLALYLSFLLHHTHHLWYNNADNNKNDSKHLLQPYHPRDLSVLLKQQQQSIQPRIEPDDKFILYDNELEGQGLGNIVAGLLSAHLLGYEFQRIVCILPKYNDFLQYFEPIYPPAVVKCPILLEELKTNPEQYRRQRNNQFYIINYQKPPNECKLKDLLQSNTTTVLYMNGNTYPRWPKVPNNFFFQYYQPKPELYKLLSYDPHHAAPTTVIHLRFPDSINRDKRPGLDPATLKALSNTLPKGPSTYLVTNYVAYYEQFTNCCQWSHPPWNTVIHSANKKQWGYVNQTTSTTVVDQNGQMWADWYTILIAKVVYHTHSDFSNSAVHWMNHPQSFAITGSNRITGALKTTRESWIVDGETIPLSQRTIDATGNDKLRLCNEY